MYTIMKKFEFIVLLINHTGSRLSAVEADGCQVSRPLRGLHDFTPTACVRSMRTWGGAWHVDLDTWAKRGGHGGSGRSMTAC